MMGNSMIISGESDLNPRGGAVEIGPAMDFFLEVIIDVHFSERGRLGRLITAVSHFPQDLGIGIDENTAFFARNHSIKVIGEGSVYIVDAAASTYNNLPTLEKGESLALHNIRLHVLPHGGAFDLQTRSPLSAEQNGQPAESSNRGTKKERRTAGRRGRRTEISEPGSQFSSCNITASC